MQEKNAGINKFKFEKPTKLIEILEKLLTWNELSYNFTFVSFVEQIMEESGYLNWILNHENSFSLLNKLNSFIS